jgi:hypothetical protein
MEQPPTGQEVIGILADGTETLIIWNGDKWVRGVANDPAEAMVEEEIVNWRWRAD